MNLLYVATAYEPAWRWGGPPRSASTLCRALAQAGIAVTVYCTDYDAQERLDLTRGMRTNLAGVDVTYFHAHCGPRVAFSPGLEQAVLANARRFDLIHIDSFWQYPGATTSLAAWLRGAPYVISPRGSLIRGALRTGSWAKRLHARTVGNAMVHGAAAIHLTAELERVESAASLRGVRTFVVPNAVTVDDLAPVESRREFRERLNLPHDAFLLIYSGRLHPRKALPVLVEAVAQARKTASGIHLLLAGADDGEESRLRALVSTLDLTMAVHFLGHLTRPQLTSALCASDAIVLAPYAGENFGNAAVEGMQLGLPAILSSNVGVCREAEEDGAAVVVPVASSNLAAAIRLLATDPHRCASMAVAAGTSAQTRFAPDAVAQAMIYHYKQVLA